MNRGRIAVPLSSISNFKTASYYKLLTFVRMAAVYKSLDCQQPIVCLLLPNHCIAVKQLAKKVLN